ncbi:MAG: hypothetical protein QOG43_2856 [Actinomycetota bacterium]|jgi:glycosyltransferase involved in cell wall biosynthesis|nr:hypothetical protein [Actinomycetota bacterium]
MFGGHRLLSNLSRRSGRSARGRTLLALAADALQTGIDVAEVTRLRGPDSTSGDVGGGDLVSVCITTFGRPRILIERAIASALRQTWSPIEIIVVADGCPDTEALAPEILASGRVRFVNLGHRSPYPTDPFPFWQAKGVPPRNVAVALARGAWLALVDDDDELTDDHVERLLMHAREHDLDVVYSKAEVVEGHDRGRIVGDFPLRGRGVTTGSYLYSARFRSFPHDDRCWMRGEASDYDFLRRLARAGCRIGFLDEVTLRVHH